MQIHRTSSGQSPHSKKVSNVPWGGQRLTMNKANNHYGTDQSLHSKKVFQRPVGGTAIEHEQEKAKNKRERFTRGQLRCSNQVAKGACQKNQFWRTQLPIISSIKCRSGAGAIDELLQRVAVVAPAQRPTLGVPGELRRRSQFRCRLRRPRSCRTPSSWTRCGNPLPRPPPPPLPPSCRQTASTSWSC